MELVHVHQGFIWFPAVTGLAESSPSNLDATIDGAIPQPDVPPYKQFID